MAGVRFAIFGLGDSEYLKTFGDGSRKLAEMLLQRGAHAIGERLVHDASSGDLPEELALPWAEGVVTQVAAA